MISFIHFNFFMADESGKEQSKNTWPVANFAFAVTIGNAEAFFTEVSGLDTESAIIEYSGGNSKNFSTIKMPGIKKYSNITLKRGLFKDAQALRELYTSADAYTVQRQTVLISLIDESKAVAMSWKLKNAFPVKITAPAMNAGGNEVAVETLELAHEGLEISK